MIQSPIIHLLLAAGTAVLLDIFLGDPPNAFHPVAWMGKLISFLWGMRPSGSAPLFFFGLLVLISGSAVFVTPMILIRQLFLLAPNWVSVLLTGVLLKPVFSLRKLIDVCARIAGKLKSGDLAAARKLTAYNLVSRSADRLSEEDVSGAVIESLAENLTDSFTAPILFFLFFGLPGAWFYRFVNTSDAMLGYRDGDREWGGKAAALLDDLLNSIPARITGLIILAAGPVVGKFPFHHLGRLLFRRSDRKVPSPNGGWTMGAAAFILGIRLEKRDVYIIHPEGRTPTPEDIGKCIVLISSSAAVFCILCALLLTLLP